MFKKKKGKKIPGPFVYILKDMFKSDAFKELTNASRMAYLLLRAQCREVEQDEVKCPYSTAQEYMKTNTYSRSIKQLIKLGFIEKSQQGGLYRKVNVYKFSKRWRDYHPPQYLTM